MADNLKTIREALDWLSMPGDAHGNALTAACRSALDALEAELAKRIEGRYALTVGLIEALFGITGDAPLDDIVEAVRALKQERDTLRARLAPADSTPGDAMRDLIQAARKVPYVKTSKSGAEPWLTCLGCGSTGSDDCATDCWADALESATEAAEAHLRSQQPESDDQRAPLQWRDPETAPNGLLIGAFRCDDGKPFYEIDEMDDRDREGGWCVEKYEHVLMLCDLPQLPTKARDAEGGKS